MDIQKLIKKLEAACQLQEDSQPELKEFCQSDAPLARRFEVWKLYVNKKKHLWVIRESDVPVIGKMVEECWPYVFRLRCRLF